MDSHVLRIIPLQQNRWVPQTRFLSFDHQDLGQEQHQHGKAGEDPIVWQPKSHFQRLFQRVQTGGNRQPSLKRYMKQ